MNVLHIQVILSMYLTILKTPELAAANVTCHLILH
jgi:hypothetical protein